jgi:polygalacturonase
VARNIIIRTSQSNGDGIDIDSSRHVLVENCDIESGDDAICLKSGRGLEAVEIGRPAEDVLIRGCKLSSGFAGVGIGTEMSGGVRNITIQKCTFIRCQQNGIFIKSRTNRGGFIENITGEDLEFQAGCGTFLGIDLVTKGIEASRPVTGDDRFPRARNIVFRNIKVDGVPAVIVGRNIAQERPVDGLVLANISGSAQAGIALSNCINVKAEDVNVKVGGKLWTLVNVKGEGLGQ